MSSNYLGLAHGFVGVGLDARAVPSISFMLGLTQILSTILYCLGTSIVGVIIITEI